MFVFFGEANEIKKKTKNKNKKTKIKVSEALTFSN